MTSPFKLPHRPATREVADALDRACDRIWFEIRALLPRHRWLSDRGELLTAEQTSELTRVSLAIDRLRTRSCRYRDVLRDEAWARRIEATETASDPAPPPEGAGDLER